MNQLKELSNVEKIKQLVDYLNLQRNAYYNENSPNISDAEYDRIFDELVELEKQTGFVLSNSPTQTVGYTPISELPKIKHPVPLLSLDKTKQVQDLISFAGKQPVLFMLKLDGLTTKLVYENGTLVEASTRGDTIQILLLWLSLHIGSHFIWPWLYILCHSCFLLLFKLLFAVLNQEGCNIGFPIHDIGISTF